MAESSKYHHVVKFDNSRNVLIINRIFEDGSDHLYTEISVTLDGNKSKKDLFLSYASKLGEDIMLDSIECRIFFDI